MIQVYTLISKIFNSLQKRYIFLSFLILTIISILSGITLAQFLSYSFYNINGYIPYLLIVRITYTLILFLLILVSSQHLNKTYKYIESLHHNKNKRPLLGEGRYVASFFILNFSIALILFLTYQYFLMSIGDINFVEFNLLYIRFSTSLSEIILFSFIFLITIIITPLRRTIIINYLYSSLFIITSLVVFSKSLNITYILNEIDIIKFVNVIGLLMLLGIFQFAFQFTRFTYSYLIFGNNISELNCRVLTSDDLKIFLMVGRPSFGYITFLFSLAQSITL